MSEENQNLDETRQFQISLSRGRILEILPRRDDTKHYQERMASILWSDVRLPQTIISDPVLQDLITSSDSTLEDIAERIKLDPDLSVKIVKIGNSAAYSRGGVAHEFDEIVHRIGLKEIRNMVYSSQLAGAFKNFKVQTDWNLFWSRSILMARLVEQLVSCIYGHKSYGFATGLLHDTGSLLIREFFPDESHQIETLAANHMSQHQAEERILGFHHAHISGILCLKWKFPRSAAMGVYHHHTPTEKIHDRGLTCYALCNLLADRLTDTAFHWHNIHYYDEQGMESSSEWNALQAMPKQSPIAIDLEKEAEAADRIANEISATP